MAAKFKLVVEDNGSQPQLAVRAVQKLIKSDDGLPSITRLLAPTLPR
jgi:ABC-type branched-subunit amino acid transport system substrate-binding protein